MALNNFTGACFFIAFLLLAVVLPIAIKREFVLYGKKEFNRL